MQGFRRGRTEYGLARTYDLNLEFRLGESIGIDSGRSLKLHAPTPERADPQQYRLNRKCDNCTKAAKETTYATPPSTPSLSRKQEIRKAMDLRTTKFLAIDKMLLPPQQ